jgi:hypothetical protein
MAYQNKKLDTITLETESGPVATEIEVDSLECATIRFGNGYTLRLPLEQLTGLVVALEDTVSELEEIQDYGFSE